MNRWLPVVLIVLIAVVAGATFLATHERVDERYALPRAQEVAADPLHALREILLQSGYELGMREPPPSTLDLPSSRDTVVLNRDARLNREEAEGLVNWVAGGGHMVFAASRLCEGDQGRTFGGTDVLLDYIGVSLVADAKPKVEDDSEAGNADKTATDATGASVRQQYSRYLDNPANVQPAPAGRAGRDYWGELVYLPWRPGSLRFDAQEPIWTLIDTRGVFAGQLAYGEGLVTVVADGTLMCNGYIGQGDHAFVVARLLGPPALSGAIWFVEKGRFPSILSLLWTYGKLPLGALAATLILLLWWGGRRLGPAIVPPAPARKAFREHIEATGRYLWSTNARGSLLENAQQAFLADFERRHPRARQLDDEARNHYLGRLSAIQPAAIARALAPLAEKNPREFAQRMEMLQELWKKL